MKTKVCSVSVIDNRDGEWNDVIANSPVVIGKRDNPWIVDYFSNRARFGYVTRTFSSRDAARRFRRNLRNKETN